MYRDFIARFVIGRSGRLLDMGCGLGYFLQEMAAHPTWSSQGCEISPTAVRYARTRLSLTDVLCARLEEAPYPPESFDIVTLWDVLDHLLAPDPVLRRCHTLLRPGGFCFIRTPNVALHLPRARAKRLVRGMRTGLAYLQARDHMHHYSMAALRQLLRRNGFAAIAFIHLHPVESISRRGSALARLGREAWYQGVRALAVLSSGRLNYDNLFVVASKARAPR
jgi:SAM-dependent methyltransferase